MTRTLSSRGTGSRLHRVFRGSSGPSWALASQLVTSGGNFVTSAIIVRQLGLTEFGRFSVAVLLIMIVRNFFNGTVLVPISVIGPKLRSGSVTAYRGFILLNTVVFSFGTSFILFAIARFSATFMTGQWFADLAAAMALANITANTADFFRRYEFARFRPAWAFAIDAVRFFVQLATLAVLATVFRSSFTSASALQSVAAGGAAATILGMLIYGAIQWRVRLARALWPRHWHFIRWMLPGVALDSVQANAPLFIGGAVLGEAALGGVRAVQQLANILSLPTNALQQVAPAMASQKYREAGSQAMSRLLIRLSAVGFMVLLGSSVVVLVAWTYVAQMLFRSHNAHLLEIFLVYCLVNLSSLIKQMMFVYFQSVENPRAVSETSLVGAIATVLAIFALVAPLGDLAIPMASSIAAALTIVFLVVRVKHPASWRRTTGLITGRSAI